MKIRNKTGKCCHPDCDEPVSDESEIFCPEHKRQSERAALRLQAEERKFYGSQWPATQFELDDA